MDLTVAHQILQNHNISYAITGPDLTVLEISDAAGIFAGPDFGGGVGRSLVELAPELTGNEAILADLLAGNLPHHRLNLVNRKTARGRTVYLTLLTAPCRNRNGQITGLIHSVQDVTEMGALDQQLSQGLNELRLLRDRLARQNLALEASNTNLQRLTEMKSSFVAVAAHELRSPLISIAGFVEMLLNYEGDSLDPSERREFLEIVLGSARRLLAITTNLLDLTRIETGRVELLLQPLNLTPLVKAVVAELRPQLEAKSQQLALYARPDLPPVLGDETRTMQVVGNLLSNAIRYTPPGGAITVNLAPAEEEGYLQISVADTGVGIAREDQPRLFKRFFRAASAGLTGANGTGLGLHITKLLVELHGGRIWFDSEPGQGSTFFVTLPVT